MARIILKPHVACEKYGEIIEMYHELDPLPFAIVHIDLFDGDVKHELYMNKNNVTVELVMVDE